MSHRIAVVSVSRSDYGIYRPLLQAITAEPAFELALIIGGSHLARQFGNTLDEILADGFAPRARVDCTLAADSPSSVARTMGLATLNFATAYENIGPDLLIVLGDRYEMHAAATAAVPMLIPVAHIAGGSITRGAIDDSLRHSITKLSHLHFPETAEHGNRIMRLGEAEWRIHVVGSLAIDNLKHVQLLSLDAFNDRFGLRLSEPPLLVTFHPVTREIERTAEYADALLAALDTQPYPVLFTYPNADPTAQLIIDRIEGFVRSHVGLAFVSRHLGTQGYFSAMALARAMVGNSSSGLVESPSFRLPVVNVGRRQEGRLAPANVLSCGHDTDEISAAIAKACSPGFRTLAQSVVNPYGDGKAAPRIVEKLKSITLDEPLLVKEAF